MIISEKEESVNCEKPIRVLYYFLPHFKNNVSKEQNKTCSFLNSKKWENCVNAFNCTALNLVCQLLSVKAFVALGLRSKEVDAFRFWVEVVNFPMEKGLIIDLGVCKFVCVFAVYMCCFWV